MTKAQTSYQADNEPMDEKSVEYHRDPVRGPLVRVTGHSPVSTRDAKAILPWFTMRFRVAVPSPRCCGPEH
jgi:hypothetical protein